MIFLLIQIISYKFLKNSLKTHKKMEHKQSGGNIQLPYQIMIKDIVINIMSLPFLIIC